jgi:hypothetical protein
MPNSMPSARSGINMEPHILNLNFPDTIETARLTIRSPLPGDGPEFNAAIL